jgi:hypothetical protein
MNHELNVSMFLYYFEQSESMIRVDFLAPTFIILYYIILYDMKCVNGLT